MDDFLEKAVAIQESRSNLTLNPLVNTVCTDKVLVGKIISIRNFKRFTILEFTQKTWKLGNQLKIEKIEENFFKFTFGEKKDRDYIYRNRPWSLNGSLLVLKEWPKDRESRT